MLNWLKQNYNVVITFLLTMGTGLFLYSCESKVLSIDGSNKLVTRAELNFELTNFMKLAELRMVQLDQRDELRNFILQNAMVLLEGQPLNPLGIITGIAALYGVTTAGGSAVKKVTNGIKKRKVKNGTG